MELLKEANDLTDLDIFEVSLVGKPANKRKFLLIKSKEGQSMSKELEEREEEEISKALSDKEENAVQGAIKLLSKVPGIDSVLKQLAKLVPGYGEDKEGAKSEDYEKLKKGKKDEDYKEPKEKSEIKAQLETIEKERDSLKERVTKAETEVAALKKATGKQKIEAIAKSLIGKFEDNVAYLEGLAEVLPETQLNQIIAREQLHAKQMAESELFKEKGSGTPQMGSAEEKILALVKGHVVKGGNNLKVWDEVIHANPELYDQYLKETNKAEAPK